MLGLDPRSDSDYLRTTLKVVINLLCAFVAAGPLSGCATIGNDASGQAVWFRSDPPGADIEVGGRVVGQTPQYVIIPRERQPKLYLSRDGIRKPVVLETKYRWQASFFSNMVFYVFAPIGWGVDFLTGKAWTPQDPGIVSLRKPGDTKSYPLPPLASVAIAPTQADSVALSNAAVGTLTRSIEEKNSRAKAQYKLVPYDSTLSTFLERGYDFDGEGIYDDERFMLAKLPADGFWKSKLTPTDDGFRLDASLVDKRTQALVDEIHVMADPSGGISNVYEKGRRLFGLPNAVTVTFGNQRFDYTRGTSDTPINLSPETDVQWWEQGLSYLNAISITNIPAYRSGRSGRWQFSFYPILKFSHRNLVASGAADIEGQKFGRWLIALGYGPELGYQFGRSYIYANLFLNAAWSEIDWRFNHQNSSLAQTGFLASSEFGYLYSISDYWSVRAFVASSGENAELWKEALNRTSSSPFPIDSSGNNVASVIMTGISIGFSFEPFIVGSLRAKQALRERSRRPN